MFLEIFLALLASSFYFQKQKKKQIEVASTVEVSTIAFVFVPTSPFVATNTTSVEVDDVVLLGR